MTFEEILNQAIALLQRQGRAPYRAMAMALWLPQAEAMLAQVEGSREENHVRRQGVHLAEVYQKGIQGGDVHVMMSESDQGRRPAVRRRASAHAASLSASGTSGGWE
jgi:hypothetical protein